MNQETYNEVIEEMGLEKIALEKEAVDIKSDKNFRRDRRIGQVSENIIQGIGSGVLGGLAVKGIAPSKISNNVAGAAGLSLGLGASIYKGLRDRKQNEADDIIRQRSLSSEENLSNNLDKINRRMDETRNNPNISDENKRKEMIVIDKAIHDIERDKNKNRLLGSERAYIESRSSMPGLRLDSNMLAYNLPKELSEKERKTMQDFNDIYFKNASEKDVEDMTNEEYLNERNKYQNRKALQSSIGGAVVGGLAGRALGGRAAPIGLGAGVGTYIVNKIRNANENKSLDEAISYLSDEKNKYEAEDMERAKDILFSFAPGVVNARSSFKDDPKGLKNYNIGLEKRIDENLHNEERGAVDMSFRSNLLNDFKRRSIGVSPTESFKHNNKYIDSVNKRINIADAFAENRQFGDRTVDKLAHLALNYLEK